MLRWATAFLVLAWLAAVASLETTRSAQVAEALAGVFLGLAGVNFVGALFRGERPLRF